MDVLVKKYLQTSKIRLAAAGLSASRLPACPAVYRIFKGGAKIFTVYA